MDDSRLLYTFRGWIFFLVFMDLSIVIRSYVEKRSFLTKSFPSHGEYNEDEYTASRVVGMFSLLKAAVLATSTLCIHDKSAVYMGICSIVIALIMYITETLYFRSAIFNFYVVFPCLLNGLTLIGLISIPYYKKIWEPVDYEDENKRLLKKASAMRKRKKKNDS